MKKLFLILISVMLLAACGGGKQLVATGPCPIDPAPAPVVKMIPPPAPVPAPAPVPVVMKEIVIYFDFDKFALKNIKPSEIEKMKNLLAFLKSNPEVAVRLAGHTDWYGSDAYNMTLSDRRAKTVKTYLIDGGIAASRISTIAKGESELVSKTDAALNRRVVVIQLK
jgi:outer membrane protein OmpA-like peptidoglycan-associated protein